MKFLTSLIIILLIISCSSLDRLKQSQQSKNSALNSKYEIYYYNKSGVRIQSSNSDSLVIPLSSYLVDHKISPDKNKIAIAYTESDSQKLVIINTKTKKLWPIKSIISNYHFTFEWSLDSKNLGVGYYSEKKVGNKFFPDKGEIFISTYDVQKEINIGCKVSKIFIHWLKDEIIIVSDGKKYYGVNPEDCKTIFSFSVSDKRKISFSPDGKKVFYTKYTSVYSTSSNRNINVPELYLADFNGKNQKKIIDYKYEPQNIRWAPNSNEIICDVKSQEWTDIRHICTYSLTLDNASFNVKEDFLGLPKSNKPFYSPDGKKIAYEKSYKRGNSYQFWFVYQNVVEYPKLNKTVTISEIITQPNSTSNQIQPAGSISGWIDNDNILYQSVRWSKIYNLRNKGKYTISPDKTPIFIKEIK
jgi:hypothetical protein